LGADFAGIVAKSRYRRDGEAGANQSDNGYSSEGPGRYWEKKDEIEERGNLKMIKGNRESERLNTKKSIPLNWPRGHFDEVLWYAWSSVFEVIDNTSNDLHH
jgi:hypothetical protein